MSKVRKVASSMAGPLALVILAVIVAGCMPLTTANPLTGNGCTSSGFIAAHSYLSTDSCKPYRHHFNRAILCHCHTVVLSGRDARSPTRLHRRPDPLRSLYIASSSGADAPAHPGGDAHPLRLAALHSGASGG